MKSRGSSISNRFLLCALLSCFLFVLLFSSNLVKAIETPEQLDTLKEGIDKVQDIKGDLETAKTDFLMGQWKSYFLKLPVISQMDSFLQQISILFVIFLSKSYSFSIEFFFALVLWIITLASFLGYANSISFIKADWQRWLFAAAISVILAQIQLFNYFSKALVNLIFYPSAWYWKIITFLLAGVIIFVYYQINKILSRYFISMKKSKEAGEQNLKVRKNEATLKGIAKAMS